MTDDGLIRRFELTVSYQVSRHGCAMGAFGCLGLLEGVEQQFLTKSAGATFRPLSTISFVSTQNSDCQNAVESMGLAEVREWGLTRESRARLRGRLTWRQKSSSRGSGRKRCRFSQVPCVLRMGSFQGARRYSKATANRWLRG